MENETMEGVQYYQGSGAAMAARDDFNKPCVLVSPDRDLYAVGEYDDTELDRLILEEGWTEVMDKVLR